MSPGILHLAGVLKATIPNKMTADTNWNQHITQEIFCRVHGTFQFMIRCQNVKNRLSAFNGNDSLFLYCSFHAPDIINFM